MADFLAIDTSSRYLTVAARKGEKTVVRHLPECAMQHSVILIDEIEKTLRQAELSLHDCAFFAAVVGPGSFTGIRIGVSTVKGFALGAGKPLMPITSFEMIAYNVKDENFCVAIDAGRGNYYVCGFGADKKITLQPCYMSGEGVAALNMPVYGFEDLPFERYVKLDVKNCLCPAVCAGLAPLSNDICALYVRKSQAEENRNAAKKLEI